MKKLEFWFTRFSLSLLIGMFCFLLPLEHLLQVMWLNGYKDADFWIENVWKVILCSTIVLSPLHLMYYKKTKKTL